VAALATATSNATAVSKVTAASSGHADGEATTDFVGRIGSVTWICDGDSSAVGRVGSRAAAAGDSSATGLVVHTTTGFAAGDSSASAVGSFFSAVLVRSAVGQQLFDKTGRAWTVVDETVINGTNYYRVCSGDTCKWVADGELNGNQRSALTILLNDLTNQIDRLVTRDVGPDPDEGSGVVDTVVPVTRRAALVANLAETNVALAALSTRVPAQDPEEGAAVHAEVAVVPRRVAARSELNRIRKQLDRLRV
jgi:hypothetical protein